VQGMADLDRMDARVDLGGRRIIKKKITEGAFHLNNQRK